MASIAGHMVSTYDLMANISGYIYINEKNVGKTDKIITISNFIFDQDK